MHFCFGYGHDAPDMEGDELDMCSDKTCAHRWRFMEIPMQMQHIACSGSDGHLVT